MGTPLRFQEMGNVRCNVVEVGGSQSAFAGIDDSAGQRRLGSGTEHIGPGQRPLAFQQAAQRRVAVAASKLGIGLRTLYEKLKRYDLR